jgi:hypothetical protein
MVNMFFFANVHGGVFAMYVMFSEDVMLWEKPLCGKEKITKNYIYVLSRSHEVSVFHQFSMYTQSMEMYIRDISGIFF